MTKEGKVTIDETSLRMTNPGNSPTSGKIDAWIGHEAWGFWNQVVHFIERNYLDVFSPEWLFGGKRHGWSLRYKNGRSFCTLIQEKNRFAILIVFGAEEREKVENIWQELSSQTQEFYDEAAIYHNGKWVLLKVDTEAVICDVERLLLVKRKPQNVKK